ncbi:hypothetical protein QO002_001834 [Pararhizobium capsulatum DSM 1112]|uniref:Transposase n=1 Tax=Pararhizobium capsulatum DSM 1112 TaxID=1121113 RepID=A0ABU0BN60_9HYPH|nr:hypothetical protein [Pararhizobium capsulatum]MDQ0319696.1 hypothetical protein [Pararhizobium capsulatum DSM 1112]
MKEICEIVRENEGTLAELAARQAAFVAKLMDRRRRQTGCRTHIPD